MATALKITRVGTSVAVVLPEEVLEKLHVGEGNILFLSETPAGIELSALDEKARHQMNVAQKVMAENRNLLHKLSQ